MAPMDKRLSIGKFSVLCGLSIKALRHYDELGLLRPSEVHPQTGYRYYLPSQVEAAQQIRALRQMELPLEEIRVFLTLSSSTDKRAFLESQKAELQRRMAQSSDALRLLDEAMRGPVTLSEGYAVSVQDLPALKVVSLRAEVSQEKLHAFISESFFKLYGALIPAGVAIAGPSMTLFHQPLDAEEADVEVALPVGDDSRLGAFSIRTIPSSRAAVALHAGSYDGLARCHAAILLWAEQKGLELGSPVSYAYLVGPPQTREAEQLRTEVRWPLAPTA
jgi:DNA-binding transcriptional MerR regulator